VPLTASAQDSARNTLGLVHDIMRLDTESRALNAMAQAAARDTATKSQAALAAVEKSRQASAQAQMRTVVARINLAALGADAGLQRAYDALVSTYVLARPSRVADVRRGGLGYGDAALCLAVSRGGSLDATQIANLGQATNSMVDAAVQSHAPTRGAALLLKFLAVAMEQEGVPTASG
jgi:hypothetical protein